MARRVLIVLDLNGTLLHRLTKSSDVAKAKCNPHVLVREPLPLFDTVVNSNPIIFRPHLKVFLKGLMDFADLAVWTSAMSKNAVPMVARTFAGVLNWEAFEQLDPETLMHFCNHFPLETRVAEL